MNSKSSRTGFLTVIPAVVSAALFGMAAPAGKVLLRDINPVFLAGLLYLGACAGLLPVMLAGREPGPRLRLDRANSIRLCGAVVLGGIAGPVLLLSGLRIASASSVSLWLNFELIATAVLGYLFFRDYLGVKGWIGVCIALLSGVMLAVNEGSPGPVSALLVISACVCWGFDNHFTAMIDGISATRSTFIKGLAAGTVNTAVGFYLADYTVTGGQALLAMALGSVSYGLSIVLYIISAQRLGAIRSQIIFSSAPFFGVFFSVVLLGEGVSMLQGVSFVLLVLSIAAMTMDRHEHLHEHAETEHTHLHSHDDMHHDHVHEENVQYHEHMHRHERTVHSHPHWPDMHHRHEH